MKPTKRQKRILQVAGTIAAGAIAMNLLAWRHATRFVNFSTTEDRTPPPEKLGILRRLAVLVDGVSVPRPENRRTPKDVGLDYFTGSVKSRDGVRIEYWRISSPVSDRPVVLLFHGYGGSKEGLLGMAAEFANWGCDTWLVDFRGSGGSEGNRTTVGWSEACDVEVVFKEARRVLGERRIFLYGGSMGGAAVLRAASLGWVEPQGIIAESTFDRLHHTIGVRFKSMGVPAFPAAGLLTYWGGGEAGYDGFAHNPVSYAATLHCPLLLLHGDRDRRVTLDQTLALKAAAGDSARLIRFANAGHEGGQASAPAEWRAAVRDFIGIH